MASRNINNIPAHAELRHDPVSGEWVLISAVRAKRPQLFAAEKKSQRKDRACPFDDPQTHGNAAAVWQSALHPTGDEERDHANWFVQIIPNKYPIIAQHDGVCPKAEGSQMHEGMQAIGFHEVVITRPHDRHLPDLSADEISLLLSAYKLRMRTIMQERCIKYVLIFHNYGERAGASVPHPHSQLLALPVLPRDIQVSLRGSERYYRKHGQCVYCTMLERERRTKTRVVCENEKFIAVAPYASAAAYEVRIFPKIHASRFEQMDDTDNGHLAEVLGSVLCAIKNGLDGSAYNFFIHTAPSQRGAYQHYHWHIEILPKTNTQAGVELGTGVEVITVRPEDAAAHLRKYLA